MELGEYVQILRRYWVSISICVLTGIILGAVACLTATPTYTAKTQLFVAIQGSGTVSELQQGNTFTQARVQSYVRTVTTPAVLQPVVESLGLDETPGNLSKRVSASSDAATVLISISVSDASPVQAAAIAASVADSLIVAVDKLERPSEGEDSPVRLSIITPATAPVSPSSPNMPLYVGLGLLVGITVGIANAVIRRTADTKVRGEDRVRQITSVPLLGGITFDADAAKKPLLTQINGQSPRAESFRQIRTNLQFANVNMTSKAMLVTSSLPGEGKSTTATNMAIAMAQSGQRVVLVDADLRRPMIANYLGLERGAGLTTALVGVSEIDELLQPWGQDELYVLTSGQIPPNPSELLGSEAMSQLIVELEGRFDAVIIDAPPLLPVTDAAVLAQKVGGVVLIVGAGKVNTRDLEKSLSSLKMIGADTIGVVINLLPAKGPDAYAYSSYYSYVAHEEPQAEARRQTNKRTARSLNGSHVSAPKRFGKDSDVAQLIDERS